MLGLIQHVPLTYSVIGTLTMTSVNTNAAAITALRTLQNTQAQLDSTQSRISTGYKIGEAKDNAAYWAISTTLKSDNKALGTVKDALGLGASTVDVAYQSLTKAKDVLDEIKSKLVAATQDGVDKTKVQSEIAELQKQLKAISASSNFSGENWLNVDTSVTGTAALTKKVVSSYSTDGSGSVSIGTIDVDTSSMVLINRDSTREGILNGGKNGMTSAMTGGLDATPTTGQVPASATNAKSTNTITAPGTSNIHGSDNLTINYKVDGQSYSFTVAYSAYSTYAGASNIDSASATSGKTATDVATFLESVLNNNTDLLGRATVSRAAGVITLQTKTLGSSGSAEFTGWSFGTAGTDTSFSGATGGVVAGADAKTTMQTNFGAGNALTLDDNDSLTFDVLTGTGASQVTTRVSINKALISDVLNSTDGKIANISDYKAVLTQALKNAGLTGVSVSGSTAIVLTNGKADIKIANVTTSQGTDLTSFDMSNATSQQLSVLISAVNSATHLWGSRRFKTRSGDTVRLVDLLDEAVQRMSASLLERIKEGKTTLTEAEAKEAAHALGYGAVKYADLKQNPTTDYQFSYDRCVPARVGVGV